MGQEYLGQNSIERYAIQAQTGDPDNDWSLLCDPCSSQQLLYDYKISDYGATIIPNRGQFSGTWTDGVGWEFVFGGNTCTSWQRQNVPSITISSIRIKGVFGDPQGLGSRAIRVSNTDGSQTESFDAFPTGAGSFDLTFNLTTPMQIDYFQWLATNGGTSNCTGSHVELVELIP